MNAAVGGGPLRVAFIGTSHIHTRDYVEVCATDPDVRLVGVAAPDPDAPFTAPSSVPLVDAPSDLAAHDLSIITTDIRAHDALAGQLTAPALVMEKPLGRDAQAAHRVASALPASTAVFMGYFLRTHPATATAEAALREGIVGRVRRASFTFRHSGFAEGWLCGHPCHLSRERMGYGVFGDLASHLVDAALGLLGPLTPGTCRRIASEHGEVDAGGEATLLTADGAVVSVMADALASATVLHVAIDGERGSIAFDGRRLVIGGPSGSRASEYPMPTPACGLRATLRALRAGQPPPTDTLARAVETQRVLDALHALAD